MTKKSITFLSIFLVTAILIAGGVLWYGEKVQREERMAQQQIEEQQRQRETAKEQSPQTLQDLIDRSETITLPTVDTTKWTGHYRNEQLGIEFSYPKEEGWKILDERDSEIYKDSVCVGNAKYANIAKYGYAFMEGGSDCIVGIRKSFFKGASSSDKIEKNIVEEISQQYSFYNLKLSNFEKNVIASGIIGEFNSINFINDGMLLSINVDDYPKAPELRTTFFGILQTLKPITE